ncbi:MAG: hypothetical protein U0900_10780 [Myxococcota bacterium]
MKKRLEKKLMSAVLILLLASLAGASFAGDAPPSPEAKIPIATTAAEHEALAQAFRAKAAEARAEAAHHEHLARAYYHGKYRRQQEINSSYHQLAQSFEAQATHYDALAKLHEAAARESENAAEKP